jgi:hypothetical protein
LRDNAHSPNFAVETSGISCFIPALLLTLRTGIWIPKRNRSVTVRLERCLALLESWK